VLKKILRTLLKPLVYAYRRRRDMKASKSISHGEFLARIGAGNVNDVTGFPKSWSGQASQLFNNPNLTMKSLSEISRLANQSKAGIIDVLASGPLKPGSSFEAPGAFGNIYHQPLPPEEYQQRLDRMRATLVSAQQFLNDDSVQTDRLLEQLDATDYAMVDWHIDVKSGYRWDSTSWWLDVEIGKAPGADIKVPWEISRSHDLVALALNSNYEKSSESTDTLSLRLLDWIIANPARKGVNWRSTMEIAIRATNWIWALAISEIATPTSPSLLWIVAQSLEQHADFIEQYPDASGTGANNHYIADMAGLAHIAAALPSHQNSEKWADTAARGLSEQADIAIDDDGFSYEGSVGYHRFITEMLTFGTLATLRFPKTWTSFKMANTPGHWNSIFKLFEAAKHLKKPNKTIPQFGDHDAGRFLKFDIAPSSTDYPETLDHSHLETLLSSLVGNTNSPNDIDNMARELAVIGIPSAQLAQARNTYNERQSGLVEQNPRSGAWVGKSAPMWTAVRCHNADPMAPTGHLHDDALAIEFSIGEQDIFVDPGTGVYTSNPNVRNQMRSRSHHSTAGLIQESYIDSDKMFDLPVRGISSVVQSTASRFSGAYETYSWKFQREVELSANGLTINDAFESNQSWQQVFVLHPKIRVLPNSQFDSTNVKLEWQDSTGVIEINSSNGNIRFEDGAYSPHYGMIVPTKRLIIKHETVDSNLVTINLVN
jgi:hypothetical protein